MTDRTDSSSGDASLYEPLSADHTDSVPPGAVYNEDDFEADTGGGVVKREVSDIVPASSWGRMVRKGKHLSAMQPAHEVIIHHEGSGGVENQGTPVNETMKRLERTSLSHPDHIAIDYSFVASDTYKAEGRGWLIVGSHTEGHNDIAHAICAPGDYTSDDPRPALIANIAAVIAEGIRRGAILQPIDMKTHKAVFNTTCPGRLTQALPTIAAQVDALLAGTPSIVTPTSLGDDVPQIMEQPMRPGEGPRDAVKPQFAILEHRRVVLLNGASMMNDRKDGDRRVLDLPAPSDLVGWMPAAKGAPGLPNGGPMGGVVAVTADGHAFHAAWS